MTLFNTGLVREEALPVQASYADIEREPMLFQCSGVWAERLGGPLTHTLLRKLRHLLGEGDAHRLRIDARSHVLMPGWYPAIPGWHCDFMHTDARGRQVRHPARDAHVRHFMFMSSGPTCEFIQHRQLDLGVGDTFTWGEVDRRAYGLLRPAPANTLIEFDAAELHRATPWVGPPGHWRYFFRASLFPRGDRHETYVNKIRKQTQVYCDVRAGW